MCSQTRNSCAKAFDNQSRSKNLKPKNSRGGGQFDPPPPSRLIGLKEIDRISLGWLSCNCLLCSNIMHCFGCCDDPLIVPKCNKNGHIIPPLHSYLPTILILLGQVLIFDLQNVQKLDVPIFKNFSQ